MWKKEKSIGNYIFKIVSQKETPPLTLKKDWKMSPVSVM